MPLTLWKRHSATCLKTPALQKLKVEDRRLYRKCRCACWVTGNHPKTNEYLKQSLNTTSWETGEQFMRELESNTPSEIEKKKITIEEVFKSWLSEKRRLLVGEMSIDGPYTSFMTNILNFAKDRGLVLMSQFTKDEAYKLVESPLWQEWKPSTAKRQLSNLRGFFDYAIEREWADRNPFDAIKAPKSSFIQVDPYTPDEEDRLEVAFRNWTGGNVRSAWSTRPATLLCLKHVLEDTGLRISDAQQVRPAIIEILPSGDGECTLVQTKLDGELSDGDGEVTVYLKPATIAEMKSVSWISSKYPFMAECAHETDRPRWKRHLAKQGKKAYYAMQAVGATAGVADCRPHRFRHTFAVKHLINDMALEKVSRLLGHKDIKTTARYYAKWTKNRQDQLRAEIIAERQAERNVLQMPDARKVG